VRRVSWRAVAVMWVASLTSVAPVSGNVFGSDWDQACDATIAAQCTGENSNHTVYFQDVQAQRITVAVQVMQYQYSEVSDITMIRTFASSGMDVIVFDRDYGPTGWWGVAHCAPGAAVVGSAANHTRWCKPQYVKFNEHYVQATGQLDYILCHELGHTIGLRHSGEFNSCMQTGAFPGPSGTTQHDRDHINSRY
jgi:predicted Zn-dependent protease